MPFPNAKPTTPAPSTPAPNNPPPHQTVVTPVVFTWTNNAWTPTPVWATLPDDTPACAEGDQAASTIGALKARFGAARPPANPPANPPAANPPPASRNQATPANPPARPNTPSRGGRSPFAGVGAAQIIRRNDYVNPGCYVLRVQDVKYVSGRTGDNIVVEADVLTSSYDENKPETHGSNREGTRVSAFIKKNDNFDGNMKALMIALIGYDANGVCRSDEDNITPEECEAAISDAQPYKGAVVYIDAKQITTKSGNPYTRIDWWPIKMLPDGTPDYSSIN